MSQEQRETSNWTPFLINAAGKQSSRVDVSNEVLSFLRAFVEAHQKLATAMESLAETAIALAADTFSKEKPES